MNPPFAADAPHQVAEPLTERQRELLAIHDSAVADKEGMARVAAEFEALSAEEREQIDEVGWGSRRPKTS